VTYIQTSLTAECTLFGIENGTSTSQRNQLVTCYKQDQQLETWIIQFKLHQPTLAIKPLGTCPSSAICQIVKPVYTLAIKTAQTIISLITCHFSVIETAITFRM
jgi:hypothetical protein